MKKSMFLHLFYIFFLELNRVKLPIFYNFVLDLWSVCCQKH